MGAWVAMRRRMLAGAKLRSPGSRRGMSPDLLARVRWPNVGLALLAAGLLAVVVAGPALQPAAPALPADVPAPALPADVPAPAVRTPAPRQAEPAPQPERAAGVPRGRGHPQPERSARVPRGR